MSRRRLTIPHLALAVLAMWLGLWPAADAMTGASQTVVMPPLPTAPTAGCATTANACVLVQAAELSCCPMAGGPEAAKPGCCSTERNECVRCFSVGGLVLFTVTQWTLDPDLAACEAVAAVSEVGPSRSLQPPVPPPLSIS